MSVIIIGTGGGHDALRKLATASTTMNPAQRAEGQVLVDSFVAQVEAFLAKHCPADEK